VPKTRTNADTAPRMTRLVTTRAYKLTRDQVVTIANALLSQAAGMDVLNPNKVQTWNGYSAANLRRFARDLLEQWQGPLGRRADQS
jgi:hypothetical protein